MVKNGTADFRQVTTGFRNETQVQITDGLEPGDTVVTSSLLFVKPKMAFSVSVTN